MQPDAHTELTTGTQAHESESGIGAHGLATQLDEFLIATLSVKQICPAGQSAPTKQPPIPPRPDPPPAAPPVVPPGPPPPPPAPPPPCPAWPIVPAAPPAPVASLPDMPPVLPLDPDPEHAMPSIAANTTKQRTR
jgi:hypothetical protein